MTVFDRFTVLQCYCRKFFCIIRTMRAYKKYICKLPLFSSLLVKTHIIQRNDAFFLGNSQQIVVFCFWRHVKTGLALYDYARNHGEWWYMVVYSVAWQQFQTMSIAIWCHCCTIMFCFEDPRTGLDFISGEISVTQGCLSLSYSRGCL